MGPVRSGEASGEQLLVRGPAVGVGGVAGGAVGEGCTASPTGRRAPRCSSGRSRTASARRRRRTSCSGWPVAMSDQFVKGLKFIEPQLVGIGACRASWRRRGAAVVGDDGEVLERAHPDFGCASGPVDVQRYVDGRAQEVGSIDCWAWAAANELSTVAAAAPASTPAPPMSIRLRLLGVSIQAMVVSLVEVRSGHGDAGSSLRVGPGGRGLAGAPPRSGPGPVSRRRPPRARPCLGSSGTGTSNRVRPMSSGGAP